MQNSSPRPRTHAPRPRAEAAPGLVSRAFCKRGKLPGGCWARTALALEDSSPIGRGRKIMDLACKAKSLIFQVRGSNVCDISRASDPLTLSLSPWERGRWGRRPSFRYRLARQFAPFAAVCTDPSRWRALFIQIIAVAFLLSSIPLQPCPMPGASSRDRATIFRIANSPLPGELFYPFCTVAHATRQPPASFAPSQAHDAQEPRSIPCTCFWRLALPPAPLGPASFGPLPRHTPSFPAPDTRSHAYYLTYYGLIRAPPLA